MYGVLGLGHSGFLKKKNQKKNQYHIDNGFSTVLTLTNSILVQVCGEVQ